MAQTPRDCTGDFSGREQLIPAVYNVASLADQISVLPNEESVNAVLSGRSGFCSAECLYHAATISPCVQSVMLLSDHCVL